MCETKTCSSKLEKICKKNDGLFLWVPGMLYTFWLCFGEMVRLLWRRVPAADDSQKSQLGKAAKVEPIWQQ
ncbi:hypothetical protein niasHS_004921 [Heterodera schachtii]|uniref:Uncharacterized protein n=1 Tax=Heterodera schachtii TaxID=97005 RepID=A0ABD2K0D3_HETSC